jgi:hypothetical protein
MEEARQVLMRLERIEALDRTPEARPVLLAELRALVVESEAWARVESELPERTREALSRAQEVVAPLG